MKFLEKIFSVKNKNCHKLITILGIRIRIKSKNLIQEKRIDDIQKKLNGLNSYIKEIYFQNILRDTIKDSPWLKKQGFTLTLGAANYTLIYSLFKVLDELSPKKIIEFGMGQTSLVTTQYVNNKNPEATLDIFDHYQEWIDVFSKKLDLNNDNIRTHFKNLIEFELNGEKCFKYESLYDITADNKYNLVVIDGPWGIGAYPRTNILELIPHNLDEDFIIILDDAERIGEQRTAKLIFDALKNNNIEYKHSYKSGMKNQLIITSKKYEFIHWV